MGQSIMDNPETLATIGIQDTGRRNRNNNNTKQKAIKVSNTDSTKHRTWTQVTQCYSYSQDAFDTTIRKQAQMMPCKIFHYLNYSVTLNRIGDVIVSVLALREIELWVRTLVGFIKLCFPSQQAALRSKSKDCLARNQFARGLLVLWA